MKKHLRFVALVAGAAIIAAACASGGASTAPSAAPESAAPGSAAPGSEAPAGLTGEVSLWHSYSSGAGTELDALNQVLDTVKAANPDLTVEVLEVPFADIYNKWNTDVATGGGPTMFIAPNDSLGFQSREGVVADLDALLADGLTDIGQVAVDGSKVDGKLFMVPESLKAVGMFFDTAKIATPPATTDELLAAVKDGSVKAGFLGGTNAYHNFGWWAAFGGELMDDTGKCIADTTGVGARPATRRAGATVRYDHDPCGTAVCTLRPGRSRDLGQHARPTVVPVHEHVRYPLVGVEPLAAVVRGVRQPRGDDSAAAVYAHSGLADAFHRRVGQCTRPDEGQELFSGPHPGLGDDHPVVRHDGGDPLEVVVGDRPCPFVTDRHELSFGGD